jgi:hypothetical protein
VPTISSNPSTHYPTYGPTASNITDSGSLGGGDGGGDRTTTDEDGALPNNEESKEVESNNQPSDDNALSQEINYLGTIENGGNIMTCSSKWLMSSSVVAAVAMGAILLV